MLFRTRLTPLIRTWCGFKLYYQVIFKGAVDPEHPCQIDLGVKRWLSPGTNSLVTMAPAFVPFFCHIVARFIASDSSCNWWMK